VTESIGILQRTLASLDLEEVSDDVFEGHPGTGRHRLFGGLVAAQAVIAAGRTVDRERKLHSLHAYFLRPGSPGVPIRLEVTRTREGRSFSSRSIRASQGGETILTCVSSFAVDEEAPSLQTIEMPRAPDPSDLPDREQERARRYSKTLGVDLKAYDSAVEVRLCDPSVVEPGISREPRQDNWLRVKGNLGADVLLQRAMLVYASDRALLATARMPYDVGRHKLMAMSLDHAMWIHHDVDLADWHLCQCFSPVSSNSRSIVLCHIYRSDGVCVATVAQEGLVRVRRES